MPNQPVPKNPFEKLSPKPRRDRVRIKDQIPQVHGPSTPVNPLDVQPNLAHGEPSLTMAQAIKDAMEKKWGERESAQYLVDALWVLVGQGNFNAMKAVLEYGLGKPISKLDERPVDPTDQDLILDSISVEDAERILARKVAQASVTQRLEGRRR
jgi:hypothetical protein